MFAHVGSVFVVNSIDFSVSRLSWGPPTCPCCIFTIFAFSVLVIAGIGFALFFLPLWTHFVHNLCCIELSSWSCAAVCLGRVPMQVVDFLFADCQLARVNSVLIHATVLTVFVLSRFHFFSACCLCCCTPASRDNFWIEQCSALPLLGAMLRVAAFCLLVAHRLLFCSRYNHCRYFH